MDVIVIVVRAFCFAPNGRFISLGPKTDAAPQRRICPCLTASSSRAALGHGATVISSAADWMLWPASERRLGRLTISRPKPDQYEDQNAGAQANNMRRAETAVGPSYPRDDGHDGQHDHHARKKNSFGAHDFEFGCRFAGGFGFVVRTYWFPNCPTRYLNYHRRLLVF
jgi:hypothetical protein